MKVTPCECTEPGWCARHQCEKTRPLFECCQRRPDYYEAWERGELRGLCGSKSQRPATASCRHRGAETRRVLCPTCRGHVELKVFACSVRQECVLGASVEGIPTCATCPSFEAL